MNDINQISKWNKDLSRAIAALGTEDFFPLLVAAIDGQVRIDYPQVWLYHRDLPPRVLYHQIPPHALEQQTLRRFGPFLDKRAGEWDKQSKK